MSSDSDSPSSHSTPTFSPFVPSDGSYSGDHAADRENLEKPTESTMSEEDADCVVSPVVVVLVTSGCAIVGAFLVTAFLIVEAVLWVVGNYYAIYPLFVFGGASVVVGLLCCIFEIVVIYYGRYQTYHTGEDPRIWRIGTIIVAVGLVWTCVLAIPGAILGVYGGVAGLFGQFDSHW